MRDFAYAKRVYHLIKFVAGLPFRNSRKLDKSPIVKGQVNFEWVNNGNLGDMLGPMIYQWMLNKKQLSCESPAIASPHFITCGSLIGLGGFDVVVWGSGAHIISNIKNLYMYRGIRKYDIRAVRGPLTRQILLECGYSCPAVYGDPAILMPLIYDYSPPVKKYDVSVVLHYYQKADGICGAADRCHFINIATNDYEFFIQEIKSSKKVISSSLHGIILAETYGIPAVFLNSGGYVDRALLKYYDWYYSTNRWNVKMAHSIEEAIAMEPMPLPKLDNLQRKLMDVFPYDLWKQ